jgi:fatty acid synthase, animal type
MDTMLQIKLLGIDTRGLFVPTRIEKLSIDTTKHYAILLAIPEGDVKSLPITVYEDRQIIRFVSENFPIIRLY